MSSTHAAPRGGKSGKSASQGATQVIGGITMAAWKSRTAQPQNLCDIDRTYALRQQSPSDPQVHDAPIRLRKALWNVPAPHPGLVDVCGLGGGQVGRSSLRPRRRDERMAGMRCGGGSVGLLARSLQEAVGAAGQTGSGVHDFHPGGIALAQAPVGFLISKTGESAQMTPVDAGAVAAIELSQVPTDGGSQSWFQGRAADMNPGLAMPRAGLHHDTRFMPVSPHRRQHRGIGVIQVDQDVTGVSVRSIRMDIDIASFAVADPQKANGGEVCQLRRRPQAFSGKRPFGCVVDQTNEVKLTGHRRQLSADGPRGKREAEVKHAPDSATEWGCRTMNSQRVVNSVLTRCLSQGAHFRLRLRQLQSRPVLDKLHNYLLEIQTEVLPKSPEGRAVRYTLKNWTALTRYCEEEIWR